MNKNRLHKQKSCNRSTVIVGTVTVGSKGQVVIPKEVRETLGIGEGDKLMVLTKHGCAVGLVKSDDVEKFLSYMQVEIKEERLKLS